jgi:hypothetical protein
MQRSYFDDDDFLEGACAAINAVVTAVVSSVRPAVALTVTTSGRLLNRYRSRITAYTYSEVLDDQPYASMRHITICVHQFHVIHFHAIASRHCDGM